MKITTEEYKQYIRDEYIRAYTHYQAMIQLARKEGVDDIPTPEPSPDPTPTPAPDPEPTPTPDPEPSGEKEFVYNGAASYTIKRGEHCFFTILVNGVSDCHDFECTVPGDHTFIKCDDKWLKTNNGYKIEVDTRGINTGSGEYCLYWKEDAKNKDKWLRVKIIVNG